jgi:hypothetical protein
MSKIIYETRAFGPPSWDVTPPSAVSNERNLQMYHAVKASSRVKLDASAQSTLSVDLCKHSLDNPDARPESKNYFKQDQIHVYTPNSGATFEFENNQHRKTTIWQISSTKLDIKILKAC